MKKIISGTLFCKPEPMISIHRKNSIINLIAEKSDQTAAFSDEKMLTDLHYSPIIYTDQEGPGRMMESSDI